MQNAILALALLLLPLASCTCTPEVTPPDPKAVGSVRVDVASGSATLVLVDLQEALTAFQVDVDVTGGTAEGIFGLANHDIVEAGLDVPKSRFTAVVSDTRRLPLNNGALARIAVGEGASLTLKNAFGVDQSGKKRSLTVVVAP